MKTKQLKLILPAIFIATVFVACLKDTYDMTKISLKTDLNPGLSLPVAHGIIKIGDLIKTNDTIQEQDDNTLLLQFEMDTLFSMVAADVIVINNEDIGDGISSTYGIDDFTMEDIDFIKTVTLDSLANNLDPTTRNNLIAANGTNIFPSVPSQPGGNYVASESEKYEYMIYPEGRLVITIFNDFPTSIDNITVNINDNASIYGSAYSQSFTFNNIPAGATVKDSVSLVGETMYNPISFNITNIEISQNNNTTRNINLAIDSIYFNVQMKDLELSGGKAEINRPAPKDSVANQVITPEDKDDLELTLLTLKNGRIHYNVINNIGEPIRISVRFPYTNKTTGGSVDEVIIVPPRTTRIDSILLNNTITDLTLGGTTYNTFPVEYTVEVDSTEKFIEFTTTDSVIYNFEFENIKYDIIEGYFGKDTNSQSSSFDMGMEGGGMLDMFEGGFKFTEPSLNITYYNSLGVPTTFDLLMSAEIDNVIETAGGERELPIPAKNNFTSGELVYDENDNLDNIFVFPLPNIDYSVDAYTNPGTAKPHNNFITHESEMYIGMNMQVPFSLSSEGFVYKDTMAFNLPAAVTAKHAGLAFIMENELPFNVFIEAFAWDSAGNHLEENPVLSANLLKAPEIDDNGFIKEPNKFKSEITIDSDDFDKIMSSDHLIIHASIDTKDAEENAQNVKLKTTYKIDFKLVVQAQAHISRINFGGGDDDNEDDEDDND